MMKDNTEIENNPVVVAAKANIEQNQKLIDLQEAYKRLRSDPDYQLVIEESYFKEEAARVTEILTEPSVVNREVMDNLVDQLTSIRNLKSHLHLIDVKAFNAKKYIADDEDTIEQVENGTYVSYDEE